MDNIEPDNSTIGQNCTGGIHRGRLDMPTQFEGDKIRESVVINQSIDDKNNPSGYAADSEDETENTLYKSHDCRSGKTKSYGQFVSSPSKKRRKESRAFPIEDTSWIQRLYRGTPFSRTSIARKTAQDDFSFMPREPVDDAAYDGGMARFVSPSYESISNNMFVCQRQRFPYMVNGRQSILPFDHQDPFEAPSSSDSFSDGNSDVADEDEQQQEANLLKTVSDMLVESKEIQARYRSYSQVEDTLETE